MNLKTIMKKTNDEKINGEKTDDEKIKSDDENAQIILCFHHDHNQ